MTKQTKQPEREEETKGCKCVYLDGLRRGMCNRCAKMVVEANIEGEKRMAKRVTEYIKTLI